VAGKPKKERRVEAGDIVLRGLHLIFDTFGATRPIRLGLAFALSLALELFVPTIQRHGVPMPDERWVALALFGLSFCLLFWPLLIWPGLPEPTKQLLAVIEEFARRSGLSPANRQRLYLELLGIIISSNKDLRSLDFNEIRKAHEAALKSFVPTL
jgi:hypothetical protein